MTPPTCMHCATQQLRATDLTAPADRPSVGTPEDVYPLIADALSNRDREHAVTIAFDTRIRFIAAEITSIGTIDHTFMAPREILRDALLHGAKSIAVAHNHPSGDTTPSTDDRRITRRLARACDTVGIPLLDHIITGHAGTGSASPASESSRGHYLTRR